MLCIIGYAGTIFPCSLCGNLNQNPIVPPEGFGKQVIHSCRKNPTTANSNKPALSHTKIINTMLDRMKKKEHNEQTKLYRITKDENNNILIVRIVTVIVVATIITILLANTVMMTITLALVKITITMRKIIRMCIAGLSYLLLSRKGLDREFAQELDIRLWVR